MNAVNAKQCDPKKPVTVTPFAQEAENVGDCAKHSRVPNCCEPNNGRWIEPLQITEVTVPAYSWESEDEQIQAEIIEKLYSVWFSHPNVEQIVYWNLVDGYAHLWDSDPQKIAASQGDMTLGENYYYGGLLRFDLSPKPAYLKLKELICDRWHTETELTTDENGLADFRGFYGAYEAEIFADGQICRKEICLKKNGENTFDLLI